MGKRNDLDRRTILLRHSSATRDTLRSVDKAMAVIKTSIPAHDLMRRIQAEAGLMVRNMTNLLEVVGDSVKQSEELISAALPNLISTGACIPTDGDFEVLQKVSIIFVERVGNEALCRCYDDKNVLSLIVREARRSCESHGFIDALKEAVLCMQDQRYASSCLLLYSILDGLAKLASEIEVKNNNQRRVAIKKLNKSKEETDRLLRIIRMTQLSYHHAMDKMFGSKLSLDDTQEKYHRNKVMHGIGLSELDINDCIRALMAIGSVTASDVEQF